MSETESYDEPEMLARRKETYDAFIKLSIWSAVAIAIALGLMAIFLT